MKNIIVICSFFLAVFTAISQERKEPKVGVVMSGGGAKGLAHIGVLKVLEESGIKIDYIAGTSMGGIVGGLYASGYSAVQLDSIFRNIDRGALIQDYTPRESKSFYEKKNDDIYILTLSFEKFKIGVPKALSKGIYNINLLNRLMSHVRHVEDFSKLPIPFLCVATDVETGEEVVLESGNIVQSILASGAFPSLYPPVEINNRILIDGGIVNNYPVQELRNMGADIVIGVDVQDELVDRKDIEGATNIIFQISNFMMTRDMKEKIEMTDIYIKPEVSNYNIISFNEGDKIIEQGEIAAQKLSTELLEIGGKGKNILNHQVPKFCDTLHISRIENNPLETYTSRYIEGKLRFQPNSDITFSKLEKGFENLNGTQSFSEITYSLEKDGEKDVLSINLKENPVKRFLKFGLHYDVLYKTAALLNITQKKLLFKNDVASLDIVAGDNYRYNFNYYIDNGFYWSTGFTSKLNHFNATIPFPAIRNTNFIPTKLRVDYNDLSNRMYFQTIFDQIFSIGVGVEHRYFRVVSRNLDPQHSVFDKNHYFGGYGYLEYDGFDNRYFPKKGVIFKGEITGYFFSSGINNNFKRFSQITGELGFVQSFGDRLSVKFHSTMGITQGLEPEGSFFKFFLGGYGFAETKSIVPFYGYNFLNIFDNSYIKADITVDYEIFYRHHINIAVNSANVGRYLFVNGEWVTLPKYNGIALGYGFDSLIGPIEIKYSWSPEIRKHLTWFSAGFKF